MGFKAGTSRGYGLGLSGSRKLLVVSSCECIIEAAGAKSGTFHKELTEKIIYIYISSGATAQRGPGPPYC